MIRRTTAEDVYVLAENIREEDKNEIWKAAHVFPLEAIKDSVRQSLFSFSYRSGDDLLFIWGLKRPIQIAPIGIIWMLTANAVEKHKKEFVKASYDVQKLAEKDHVMLFQYVDAEYKRALRWLKWLGYTIYPAKSFGAENAPFHRVEWRKS